MMTCRIPACFIPFRPVARGLGLLALLLAAAPARPAAIDTEQSLSIVSLGGWYQEVVYNYGTSSFVGASTPVNYDARVLYTLYVNEWVGVFHYDYTSGAYTQAVYRIDSVL